MTVQATRKQSLQALENAGLYLSDNGVSDKNKHQLFEEAERLEAKQRQLFLAEAATRTFLTVLAPRRPFYQEFEELVWKEYLGSDDLERDIRSLLVSGGYYNLASTRYYNFIRGMFERSAKTRDEFYQNLISEASMVLRSEDIAFGAAAMAFLKKAEGSMDLEHLLAFYLVQLACKTRETMHTENAPMTEEEVEVLYKHFEGRFPLNGAVFLSLTSGPRALRVLIEELMPQRPLPEVFHTGTFHDRRGTLEKLAKLINGRMRKYSVAYAEWIAREDPLALRPHPYLTICQSSGWGKSRNVFELKSLLGTMLFDICLRSEGDVNEPRRTHLLAAAIEKYKSPADFICLLHGCLEAFLAHIPAEHGTGAPAAPFQGATPPSFWEEVFAATERAKASSLTFDLLAAQCRHFVEEARARGFVRILFSFDEATSLCEPMGAGSQFQALLEALFIFPSGVFAMFLDTASRAYGFPPGGLEHMVVGARGYEGYWAPLYPFILAVNVRVFEVFEELAGTTHRCGPWRLYSKRGGLLSSFLEIVYASRPLFGALLKGAIAMAAGDMRAMELWAWILALACRKLSLKQGENAAASSSAIPLTMERREWALALLATRFSLLSLSKADPEGLVANRLATLLGVSRRGPGRIIARYVPEPMVGAAAFVEMGRGCQLEDALEALVSLLDAGGASSIFATGSAGEFVAAAMAVFAYDHALRPQLAASLPTVYIGAPVTVGKYLEGLVGDKALLAFEKGKCGTLLDSFVAVLQTAQILVPINQEGLLAFFKRRCAVVCRQGEAGIDLIIPVVLSGPRDKDARTLTASDMTGIFIQVKNWQASELSQERIKRIFADMDGIARNLVPRAPYATMLVSVNRGAIGRGQRTIFSPQDGKLQIVLSGVSSQRSPCLSASMAKSLRAIAHRPSEEEEVFNANLEAEWGLSPEEVRRASRENMLLAFGAGEGQDRHHSTRRRSTRRPAASSQESSST